MNEIIETEKDNLYNKIVMHYGKSISINFKDAPAKIERSKRI